MNESSQLLALIINYPTKETFHFFLGSQIKIPRMKMNNFVYRHACSNNSLFRKCQKSQSLFHSRKQDLTESYKGDIEEEEKAKGILIPSMSDVTSSELGYMLHTFQKLSTLSS